MDATCTALVFRVGTDRVCLEWSSVMTISNRSPEVVFDIKQRLSVTVNKRCPSAEKSLRCFVGIFFAL